MNNFDKDDIKLHRRNYKDDRSVDWVFLAYMVLLVAVVVMI
jgi:hypothetical protein